MPIDSHTTLVTIPKATVLSARSCALADAIPIVPYGHAARLALSLALYGEQALRKTLEVVRLSSVAPTAHGAHRVVVGDRRSVDRSGARST
ncbi:uncharacterized protein PHACADRAFT_263649 [Phanerochaete carnosa HHB-10118-sp]|uniref:Uncharacterized protein n=1 Tax=Phanerochaete carnosa (strain HHB-10118-sp) TaxID=650164 RepID=K5VUC5_PHACS|nr:uncharacterized protein PHACADRAFT_263649 [Phanerochaete carnosa HHB-10118-sp]EKM50380.1 hypothetical protein PHACADRAFT_263649 [Phanerochaete carnosa HHB-10118-sp]